MLAMAAIGFAFAYIVYQRSVEGGSAPVAKQNTTSDKGEIRNLAGQLQRNVMQIAD